MKGRLISLLTALTPSLVKGIFAMMRSVAISIIKRGLGFRQTQDTAIIAALQQVQRDLEQGKTLPDWLVQYNIPLPVTAGSAVTPLPTGFLRLHEEYTTYYVNPVDGSQHYLPRKRAQEAREAYPTWETTSGLPSVLVIQPPNVLLIPTPTQNLTLYMTCYVADQVLSSEMENLWLANAANYLVGLAGVMVAGDVRDSGAMSKFTMMAKSGAQAFMGNIVDDELMGRALIMGRDN